MMFPGLESLTRRGNSTSVSRSALTLIASVCSRLRALSLIPVLVLIAGRRTIIGHGVSADGDGDVQGRLHDDSRQSQSEFRRCCPCTGPSYPAVHGVGQWHHARYPGYQPIRGAGQSRVLRSPREQRESAMIMEIAVPQGQRNRSAKTGIGYFYDSQIICLTISPCSMCVLQALNIISTRYTSSVLRKKIFHRSGFYVYVLHVSRRCGGISTLVSICMKSFRKLIVLRRVTDLHTRPLKTP